MNKLIALALFVGVLALASPASAAEYKCSGNSVKKSGSTKYTFDWSGTTLTIKKSGSTKGQASKSGDKYDVKVSGSTRASIRNGKIYKSGSTWSSVSEAQRTYDCPDIVAATLWVLSQVGAL